MVMTVDLGPAASRLGALVAAVPDDALTNPTPCPDYALADLLDHVATLTRTSPGPGTGSSRASNRSGAPGAVRTMACISNLASTLQAPVESYPGRNGRSLIPVKHQWSPQIYHVTAT
jgi:hypothetical protein